MKPVLKDIKFNTKIDTTDVSEISITIVVHNEYVKLNVKRIFRNYLWPRSLKTGFQTNTVYTYHEIMVHDKQV